MGASGLLRLSSLTDIRPGGMTALSLGNIVTYYERWTVAISPSHLCHHSTSALSLSPRVGMVSDKEGRAGSHSITLRLSSIYASTRARTRPRVSSPGVVIHHSDAAHSHSLLSAYLLDQFRRRMPRSSEDPCSPPREGSSRRSRHSLSSKWMK